MKKYSLHFGLNEVNPAQYPKTVSKLLCPENDAKFCFSMAVNAGFNAKQPFIGSNANSLNLLTEITAITKIIAPGDLFMLTYSGHGSQVKDIDNEEEEEGWDEVMLLYDRLFIDDEFKKLWAQFPNGSRILMITDSCHNGTVTKYVDISIGTQQPPPATNKRVIKGVDKKLIQPVFNKNIGFYKGIKSAPSFTIGASIIHIAGCKDDEVCEDGKLKNGYSLFTQNLKTTYNDGAYKGSYSNFFNTLFANSPGFQKPFWDTKAGADASVFASMPLFE